MGVPYDPQSESHRRVLKQSQHSKAIDETSPIRQFLAWCLPQRERPTMLQFRR
ncbi:hypothetical protein RESH_06034 [Rhodopirellula europaea SH398]|uniref:Uncharacterized protein n=1 Tax=Rhodopirellula europaea SH398 TaxID=1263868 RepID=M5SB64_9BACT|nr:hypothetical protein RESH_06034 [Rhodopirellula europaea SH398]